jgi:hypothetical protein
MSDMEQYKTALARHDWTFEYSDSHSEWTRGREQRQALHSMASRLDPDYSVWNALAPEGYSIKQVA